MSITVHHPAIFVLSTGRTGTQWLHHVLQKYYAHELTTVHEPIGYLYFHREHLAHNNVTSFINSASGSLIRHMDWVKERLKEKPYFEAGHQSWSSLPYLCDIYDVPIKIIHITRNPLTLARSFLSLGFYEKPFLPTQKEKIMIDPNDPGIKFTEYRMRWPEISRFEKLMYYWLELNSYGLQWIEEQNIDSIHIKFEDLFSKESLLTITDFLGLKFNAKMEDEIEVKVDEFNYMLSYNPDFKIIHNHPEIVKLATKFGHII